MIFQWDYRIINSAEPDYDAIRASVEIEVDRILQKRERREEERTAHQRSADIARHYAILKNKQSGEHGGVLPPLH